MDAETLGIRAIAVTSRAIGDAPMLPELLAQIPDDEVITAVSGLGKKIPLAPRRVMRYCGQRVVWGKGSGRGGATTTDGAWWKPRCIASSCLVKCVMARDFERQVAELQVRAALGFVAQISMRASFPKPQTDLSHTHRRRRAQLREAI